MVQKRRSAEQLGLKKGDSVTVVVKSTEVMLEKNNCPYFEALGVIVCGQGSLQRGS
jgi:hypothetical protein